MHNTPMDRRHFLGLAAALAGGATLITQAEAATEPVKPGKLRKAVLENMLPKGIADAERFRLARQCGFAGIEVSPMPDLKAAAAKAQVARDEGVPIHSVLYGWWPPFDRRDSQTVDKCIGEAEQAIRCAQAMGAEAILLVPTRVTEAFPYADAYTWSQQYVRRLIPCAEQARVVVGIENVWNRFLLSPLEFGRYLDELDSPWIKAYLDVGNVIVNGYAEDWVRTLGKRIIKLHLKDFKRQGYQWTNLLDGDVNWRAVRKALDEIGFDGWMTVELAGGDKAYLADVAGRIDRMIAMT